MSNLGTLANRTGASLLLPQLLRKLVLSTVRDITLLGFRAGEGVLQLDRCDELSKQLPEPHATRSIMVPMRFDSWSELRGGKLALMFSAPSLNGGRNSRPIKENSNTATSNIAAEAPMILNGCRKVQFKFRA